MAKKAINNIKLGAFVLAGLLFLVFLLYMIGRNEHLFGNTFLLKAKFEHAQGLVVGNNVRFSGIEVGTVKKIHFLNDTVIEVTMMIEEKMLGIIKKNAVASIGTEGLVGNKIVNIVPGDQPGPLAEENDILMSKKAVNTDEMMHILNKTNNDISAIAAELKSTVQKINNSNALWNLLNDDALPKDIREAAANIKLATNRAGNTIEDIHSIVTNVKNGKGSAGAILTDTLFAYNLNEAVLKIKAVGDEADSLAAELSRAVKEIQYDINNGSGSIHTLLKDSLLAGKLNTSLSNIQKGTDGFNQNMEALKHNFLFRGYFRKLEKQKKKEVAKTPAGEN
jgi:phospholipid/cholesterol/gamma-HCH transport system substrate-binding protein